ncbi:MAG: iron-containing alcohol dehydrogenase [Pelagibacteraceae bacterium]|nr:iron-containing alcohol dehydrogenase [Pelagibacteraceae bacterium]MBT3902807.1 iron-containing alcohol dehydrogenase [Pelagibacteraceae bacterium]MBT4645079.1 iron-containing alcohol dehydrogenase [Pelagibacteraceae bacterium]MBT6197761.1 iron-containing alcohol dehydrogenase [Pelagibacteraceae bacterium]MBT6353697.1 iron-containing alcohol dehydrogenase [Pelagibacteraceae bacterium]
MMSMNWNYPTSIWFGEKRINEIQKACESLNIQKPLIVTDPGILKTNIIEKINNSLKSKAAIFSDVQSNPTGKNVELGVTFFNSNSHDAVIAVGGGSGMDVGKGIAFMAGQERPLWDFEDIGDYWTRANSEVIKPIIAVPTTAGTGSETGRAGVYTNEETHEKKIIFHPKMLPSIVILDPELTVPLPKSLTAYTGMDALAHCLEAYCSDFYHPLSQGIALEGMNLVKHNLIKAFEDGSNLEARGNMLTASSMGSIAFQKGLGAIHSLSHPVGAIYNTHHGLTNAVFMPYVLKKNRNAIEEKIISLSRYLNLDDQTFDGFMNWIIGLREQLSIPHTLKELIKDNSKFTEMSIMAKDDPSTEGNPVQLETSDFLDLYINSYEGKL